MNRNQHMLRPAILLLAGTFLLSGCATIFTGHEQADRATREVIAGLHGPESIAVRKQYRDLSGHLRNFGVVEPNLFRGARPDRSGLRKLRDAGVVTVIDFRNSPKEVAAEAAVCRDLGLAYYNLPWSGWERNIDPSLAKRFLDIVRHEENRPAFVHCYRGAERTGTMMAVYRMEIDGWTAEKAYEEMVRYKFRPFFFGNLKDYVFEYEKGHTLGR